MTRATIQISLANFINFKSEASSAAPGAFWCTYLYIHGYDYDGEVEAIGKLFAIQHFIRLKLCDPEKLPSPPTKTTTKHFKSIHRRKRLTCCWHTFKNFILSDFGQSTEKQAVPLNQQFVLYLFMVKGLSPSIFIYLKNK